MPQFNPTYWINTISWAFVLISFLVFYHQAISLPATLRLQLSRSIITFTN